MIIGLCDDNDVQLNYINSLINSWSGKTQVECEVSIYHSAEELMFENPITYPFDLLILDIQMGNMNGMDLAKKIRTTDKDINIIFITGVRDYVYEGYVVGALRYLIKPIKEEQFTDLLDESVRRMSHDNLKWHIFTCNGEVIKVKHDDIIYVEAQGHYINIVSTNQSYELKGSISQVTEKLNSTDFFCTHRSYIVNCKHVEKINKADCLLSNGESIPVSRSNYQQFNETFIQYYRRSAL